MFLHKMSLKHISDKRITKAWFNRDRAVPILKLPNICLCV